MARRVTAKKPANEAPSAPAPRGIPGLVEADTGVTPAAEHEQMVDDWKGVADDVEAIEQMMAALPREIGTNRNSTYDRGVAARILMRVSFGQTMSAATQLEGVHPARWRSWLVASPELRKMYAGVRQVKASALFDELLDITRDLRRRRFDAATVAALRAASENLKWSAAKLDPKEYGERPMPAVVAVQINSGLDLGGPVGTRLPGAAGFSYKIESVPVAAMEPDAAQPPSLPSPNERATIVKRAKQRRNRSDETEPDPV